jgi:hypothetical protein
MVKSLYHVVKKKSDMAKSWKPLIFSLKPAFLPQNGRKTTIGGILTGQSLLQTPN